MAKKSRIKVSAEELGPRLAAKIAGMVSGLIEERFPDIEETWNGAEDGKLALAAKVALEGSPRKAVVQVKLSWSQKFEAETDSFLEDPDQGQLPIEGGD